MTARPVTARAVPVVAAVVTVLAAVSTLGVAAASGAFRRSSTAAGRSYAGLCQVPSGLPGTTVTVTVTNMGRGGVGGGAMMGGTMRVFLDRSQVPAGTVSLRVANTGSLVHELVVLPLPAGQQVGERQVGTDNKVDEAGSLGEVSKTCGSGAGDGIDPGTVGWVTLNLPAGNYELICNLPGHYASGMYSELTVALRASNAMLTKAIEALPDHAWTIATTTTGCGGDGFYGPRQFHQTHVLVRGYSAPLRQLAVRGLSDRPMFLLTNDPTRKAAHIVDCYARRMITQQRLGQQIRRFHVDALSNRVALNVDLDTTLTVAAQLAYDRLGRRLPGYESATPDDLWSRFISTTGSITLGPDEVVVRLAERAYSPVLRTAELPTVTVPWWGGRRLSFAFPSGRRT